VDIPDLAAALEWFNSERNVIQLLVKTAAEQDFLPQTWYLAISIQQYYQRRGLAHEWESTTRTALAAATQAGDTYVRARVHRSIAGAYWLLRRQEEAFEHLERTEELLTELGSTTDFAYLYSNYATVYDTMGRTEEAIAYHRRALVLYEEAGDRKGEAISLHAMAAAMSTLEKNTDAIGLVNRAMDIYLSLGDRHGEGNCWECLGIIHKNLGDHVQAVSCLKRAIEIYREVHALAEAANVLIMLGDTINVSAAATREALSAWQSALSIFEELRLPSSDEVRARLSAHSEADP
jgi:tetratricopeptide (TPR) repeat protein